MKRCLSPPSALDQARRNPNRQSRRRQPLHFRKEALQVFKQPSDLLRDSTLRMMSYLSAKVRLTRMLNIELVLGHSRLPTM